VAKIAIIGGTGLTSLKNLEITERQIVQTPYGEPSGPLTRGALKGQQVIFLPRHGYGHTIPPHKVNYRANLWTLREAGVEKVISIAAVGGIRADLPAAGLIVPDQIIDYTWSRTNTFFEEGLTHVTHIDFTEPYCAELREAMLAAARAAGIPIADRGTYGATQGPRLETAAEINRMERDGCDIVGMTGMPEAALARELGLCYATCAVIANQAAGRGAAQITMADIERNLALGMDQVRTLLERLIPIL
jgi:5'-deoxy-5'-methylthioadenosine phosphorylase